jgi:hypothetical protein
VAQLSGQLRAAVEIAGKYRYGATGKYRYSDSWRDEYMTPGLTLGDLADLLGEVQYLAKRTSLPIFWEVSIEHSVSGRLDPSVIFQQYILWLWTDEFGGRLTTTRGPISGEISGDLVRYFFAVARPVMGEATPSVQSLSDIVTRQKVFQKRLKEASKLQ